MPMKYTFLYLTFMSQIRPIWDILFHRAETYEELNEMRGDCVVPLLTIAIAYLSFRLFRSFKALVLQKNLRSQQALAYWDN